MSCLDVSFFGFSTEFIPHRRCWILFYTSTFVHASSLCWGGTIFPDVGPEIPRLRFHTGNVINNRPEISGILPKIPGDASKWYVVQWNKDALLRPDEMRVSKICENCNTVYMFDTFSGESSLNMYKDGIDVHFELGAKGGNLSKFGGSNLFLSAEALDMGASFDKIINYSVSLSLRKAIAVASDPIDLRNGNVLAQVFSGFVVQYKRNHTSSPMTIFFQIEHSSSFRAQKDYRNCTIHDGNIEIISSVTFDDEIRLPFRRMEGDATPLFFILNRHLCKVVDAISSCSKPIRELIREKEINFGLGELKNWRLQSIYIGLETQDHRRDTDDVRGNVEVSLDISNLKVERTEREFDGCLKILN